MSKGTYRITEVTKKPSNRFDPERLEYPVSLTYPAISPPPSPRLSMSSILIDGHSEGPLTEEQAYHDTEKEPTKGERRKYLICSITLHQLLTDAM